MNEVTLRPGREFSVARVIVVLTFGSDEAYVPARLVSACERAVASRPGMRSVRTVSKRAACAGASPLPAVKTATPMS
jgi:hypothetical protein